MESYFYFSDVFFDAESEPIFSFPSACQGFARRRKRVFISSDYLKLRRIFYMI